MFAFIFVIKFLYNFFFSFFQNREADHPGILKLFPKAEFKYIEGAGHWLHSEKPTEFLKITLDFLNKET